MYLLPPPDTLNPVMDLVFDSQNLLWVGIYVDYLLDGGVAMYNGYNWVDFNMSDGLIGPVISDLIIDDQDQVWVATSSGISKITDVPAYLPNSMEDQISIFPNPTNENLTLSIENYNGDIHTEVYDIIGNKLQTTNKTTISLQDYARGIYLLKIAYSDRVKEVKVFKE